MTARDNLQWARDEARDARDHPSAQGTHPPDCYCRDCRRDEYEDQRRYER